VLLSFRPKGEIFLFIQISQSLRSFEMTNMAFGTAPSLFLSWIREKRKAPLQRDAREALKRLGRKLDLNQPQQGAHLFGQGAWQLI
jgi:hypothetical protein